MWFSPSLEAVAGKSDAAMNVVNGLVTKLKSDRAESQEFFFQQVKEHLEASGVEDAEELNFDSSIKVEYTNEFSFEGLAEVIKAAVDVAAKVNAEKGGASAFTPDAVAGYKNVVDKVTQAARSSSKTTASIAFSVNRLAPGIFVFLYATAVTVTDSATLGTEAVTATEIFYRFMRSVQDVKHEQAYSEAIIAAARLLRMKEHQAALVDQLGTEPGMLTIAEWKVADAQYQEAIDQIEQSLQATKIAQPVAPVSRLASHKTMLKASVSSSSRATKIATDGLQRLSNMGKDFDPVVAVIQRRLQRGEYEA